MVQGINSSYISKPEIEDSPTSGFTIQQLEIELQNLTNKILDAKSVATRSKRVDLVKSMKKISMRF
ncbi:hypothetical protein KHA80_05480 [Anaerobacillus sp. HL2]|nr:hypothetical protein KHA80_05480 [Anaerobacillus sp. HL2]